MTAKPPPLKTIAETAEYLNVSTKTVRRLIDREELVAHRIGTQWRISTRDIELYLVRCRAAEGAI